jgi:hypothetical protein
MSPPFIIHPSAFSLSLARLRQSILLKAFTGALL